MGDPGRGKYCVEALREDQTEQIRQLERPGEAGMQKAKASVEW